MHGVFCADPMTCCNACCTFVCWVSASESAGTVTGLESLYATAVHIQNVCKHVLLKAKLASFDEPRSSQAVTAKSVRLQSTQLDHIKVNSLGCLCQEAVLLPVSVYCSGMFRQAAAFSALQFRFKVDDMCFQSHPSTKLKRTLKQSPASEKAQSHCLRIQQSPAAALKQCSYLLTGDNAETEVYCDQHQLSLT